MTTATMALGTMYFGTQVSDAAAFAILDRYVDLGGQWLDTSNNYSFWEDPSGLGGQSEALVGRWLRANPGAPVLLSTKVGAQPLFPGGFPDHLEGLASKTVGDALQASLDRLGRPAVDLYWAHVEDATQSAAQLVDTFADLVSRELIAEYGLSNRPSWLFERIRAEAEHRGLPRPSAYQQRWSYFQPLPAVPVEGQPIELGMLSQDGLDLLARNPQLSGWVYTATLRGAYDRPDRPLSGEYRHDGNARRRVALEEVAHGRGLRPGQVVLAWLASGRPALTPIVGVSSVEQVEQAWAGATTNLTDQELASLNGAAART